MDEKPLHVRVAEALGWERVTIPVAGIERCLEGGTHAWRVPGGHIVGCETCDQVPPRYDTSWLDTGPLIEKYGISISGVYYDALADLVDVDHRGWLAGKLFPNETFIRQRAGYTPCEAICNLILALAEAGKLND